MARASLGPDAVGIELPATTYEYDDRDVMLYNLGIGATELPFVYERNLKVIPTFAVIPAFPALMGLASGVEVNPVMILHGEQSFTIRKQPATKGKLTTAGKITGVYDKGKGALAILVTETKNDAGELVFTNQFGVFVRGAGGFGGDRGPEAGNLPPDRAPDKTVSMQTQSNQAMVYRLSGDRNPLHVDPDFAKMAGYDKPILHGLCSFGHVGRAVLQAYCDNDTSKFVGFACRFSGVVFPGDTITTEMWDTGEGKIILQAKTQEGRVVISNGAVDVR